MGLFNTLRGMCFGQIRNPQSAIRNCKRCHVEELEPRRMFAVDVAPHVLLGSVYFEEATGDDSKPDIIQVSFVGGAAGTTLNQLTINGDKRGDGLTDGDVFFDTAAGGLGEFGYAGLKIVSANGFTVNSVTVVDGGAQIVFNLTGFDAGEILELSVDADEAQYVDGANVEANSLVEGAEFQRSIMTGKFSAVGYVDLTLSGLYWDAFDDEFAAAYQQTGLSLNLPTDAFSTTHDFTDRTAGAVALAKQIPLASLSGWVYHDKSDDGNFAKGVETGIGGVTLELLDAQGNPTGIKTVTSTDPAKLGFYEFRNLLPGTYGVREYHPDGWIDGKDKAGDRGGAAASEAAGPVDKIFGAVLNYGDNAVEYNFGELLPGSISGRVHADQHEDCNFDDPEILLKGVQIDLLDANGNFIRSTLTDEKGEYSFTGLAPAIYQVREHNPTSYYDGGERIGSAGGQKSDIGETFSIFTGIVITSDLDAVQYDFCEKVGVTLSGNVYHDRDDDGNFDRPGEEGIGNVTLKLLDANGNDTGLRATTNSAGYYEFTNLRKGTYTVVEVHPVAWLDGKDTPGNRGGVADLSPPGDRISQITLNWGAPGIEYNFGELLPGSIAGRVHLDDGPDCNFEDPQIFLSGVKIDLLDAAGNVVATTFTNEDGEYLFTGLRPGTYSVREHQPTQYFDGGERIGSAGGAKHDVAGVFSFFTGIYVGSAVDAIQYDFCEKPPGSISGRVHADEHEECNFDDPEILLEGVQIDLLDAQGNVLKTTFTNAQGEYSFTGLTRGDYQVREHQPTAYYDGGERIGSIGGAKHDVADQYSFFTNIKLDYGVDAIQYDFCEKVGVSLSGNVYHDRSNDGIFDRETEEGIRDVTLKLLDASGNDTGLRATTNAAGFYKFTNLRKGTYTVVEVHPTGWLDGLDTPGNLGGIADNPPPGDILSQITINWGDAGVEYNFGELLPGSIAGRVHADDEPDCNFDNPRVLLSGVKIDLLDATGNVIATTFTNEQGEYLFTGLRPGVYSVREHQPTQYFDGGERIGSVGGAKHDEAGLYSIFTGINLGSGINAIQYDFCEKPTAELSGYVFIDGPKILFADQPPTAEQIAAIRNGVRTADDTPLQGVWVELRNGITGAPVTVGDALPGTYSGLSTDPLRTQTDANGYYHFGGLRAGIYAVVEIHPDGVIDNVDTPGTTGGFAANPIGLWSNPIALPTPLEQVTIDQFRTNHGTDAIALISLAVGQHSQENNFSEVLLEPEPPFSPPPPPIPVPPPENPPPPPKPPVFGPAIPPIPRVLFAPLAPVTPPPLTQYDSSVVGYTWHLSVVNAGWPRSMTTGEARYMLTSSQVDVANWQNVPLARATWTLALLDGERAIIQREDVFGTENATPVTGDFNGDGVTDIAVFIDGQWFIDLNGNGRWDEGDLWARLGTQDDLPVTGDWDADGKTDIGIYGPAWPRDPWAISREPGLPDADNYPTRIAQKMKNMPPKAEDAADGSRTLRRTARGASRADLIDHVFHYGEPGDVPLAGDWNGDGIRQIGAFHDGEWYLDMDGDGRFTDRDAIFHFGQAGDIPVVGDFTGNGVDEIGVFRSGKWIIDTNANHTIDAQDKVFELGGAGDTPVVGDWNDDGAEDPGVFHPGAKTEQVARRAS